MIYYFVKVNIILSLSTGSFFSVRIYSFLDLAFRLEIGEIKKAKSDI